MREEGALINTHAADCCVCPVCLPITPDSLALGRHTCAVPLAELDNGGGKLDCVFRHMPVVLCRYYCVCCTGLLIGARLSAKGNVFS